MTVQKSTETTSRNQNHPVWFGRKCVRYPRGHLVLTLENLSMVKQTSVVLLMYHFQYVQNHSAFIKDKIFTINMFLYTKTSINRFIRLVHAVTNRKNKLRIAHCPRERLICFDHN